MEIKSFPLFSNFFWPTRYILISLYYTNVRTKKLPIRLLFHFVVYVANNYYSYLFLKE